MQATQSDLAINTFEQLDIDLEQPWPQELLVSLDHNELNVLKKCVNTYYMPVNDKRVDVEGVLTLLCYKKKFQKVLVICPTLERVATMAEKFCGDSTLHGKLAFVQQRFFEKRIKVPNPVDVVSMTFDPKKSHHPHLNIVYLPRPKYNKMIDVDGELFEPSLNLEPLKNEGYDFVIIYGVHLYGNCHREQFYDFKDSIMI